MLGFDQSVTNAQIAPALTETCYVLAKLTEPTGAGGTKEEFVAGSAVSCAVAPKSGGKIVSRARAQKFAADERVEERTENIITLPAGTEVNEEDRIEVKGRGLFEVLALQRRSTEIGREVEVTEVVGEERNR